MAVQLHVKDTFNYEEAAHAAADIVGNLDGLPGEVSFLLAEIREKDERIATLLQRINTRHYGMTKHPSRHLANPPSGSASAILPLAPGTPIPTDHLPPKEAQTILKIQSEWDKIEALQDEKVKLAERMERIVARARERARNEWSRVGGIDVDELESEVKGWELGMGSGEIVLPPGGLGTGSDVRQKKRRPQALPLPLPPPSTHITHPPSSMPPPPAPARPSLSARSSAASYHPARSSSRADRHKSVSTPTPSDVDAEGDVDADAEGEFDLADGEDPTLYCTCQKRSYGEMIGCDNDHCEYEWFHLDCVGVTTPVPEIWFCPDCVRKMGAREKKNKKR